MTRGWESARSTSSASRSTTLDEHMLDIADSPHFRETTGTELADVAGNCRPP